MTKDELIEEVLIELELTADTVREIVALEHDLGNGEPRVREKAHAFGADLIGFFLPTV